VVSLGAHAHPVQSYNPASFQFSMTPVTVDRDAFTRPKNAQIARLG
jgi:hypothetical protein